MYVCTYHTHDVQILTIEKHRKTKNKMQGKQMSKRVGRVLERGKPARSIRGREEFCTVPEGYDLDYTLRHQKVKREWKSPGRR